MSGMPIQPGVMDYSQFNNPMGAMAPTISQPAVGGFTNTQSGVTNPPYTSTPSATAWAAPTLAASPLNVDYSKPFGNAPTSPQILGNYPNVAPTPVTANWGAVPAYSNVSSAPATVPFDLSMSAAPPAASVGMPDLSALGAAPAPMLMPQQQQAVAFGGGGCCSAQDDGTHAHGQLNLMA